MRAALLALAACGGAASTGPTRPKQEAIDPEVATKGATDLVQELYEDVGHGNTDSLQSLLDPKLMVLGPRRGDAVANRSDAILALSKWADAKRKLKPTLKSGALGVYPSSGGHSAWGCDTLEANDHHWAVMVVMSGNNELWSLDGVMLGETPAEPDLKAALKKEAAVPPAAGVTIKADPEIAPIVERFTKGLGDPQAFAADMASSDDAIVIGPAKGEIAKGKAAVAAYWKKRKSSRAAVAGEISGAATKDGMLAWVSAPIMRAEEGEDALPLRAFAVFRRSGDAWKLIGLQEAVALDAPGAGAPFKKFAPAAVKKIEEAPPTDGEEKPTKKVATKAKKKPADDEEKPAKKVATKKKASSDDDDEVKAVAKKKPAKSDDDDDAPKKKAAAKKKAADDDDEDKPVVKKKKPASDDDDDKPVVKKKKPSSDDDDDAPKKKVAAKKKPASDDDDEAPKKKPVAKHAAGDDDDTDADKQTRRHHGFGGGADDNDVPSKRFKKKKPAASDDDDEKPVAKKKKPTSDDDDDNDAPKKKKKKPADDDE